MNPHLKAAVDIEAGEDPTRRAKSEKAFKRVANTDPHLCRKWNEFNAAHRMDDEYKAKLAADKGFMKVYRAVRDATTVGAKREALTRFCAYLYDADLK